MTMYITYYYSANLKPTDSKTREHLSSKMIYYSPKKPRKQILNLFTWCLFGTLSRKRNTIYLQH
ncbi:hypothetical protein JCM19275_3558 [Nonlabens ulvanivorans]|uniref:Uncharacterized protein n=1 Tax=Nonlabens ulvanivorans TaxID=906888 RepID=A0A090WEP2_NONUL|nr:hypothetical protein JCM19275_3558 [Nonlabens ulvanivorans]